MKITLKEQKESELEVIILYPEMNLQVKELVQSVRAFEDTITIKEEGVHKIIRLSEIYYFETLERKTFLYTKNQVFRIDRNLALLYEEMKDRGFCYISRSCILNLGKLQSIRTIYNSRLQGTLCNGEKVNISRTYMSEVKKYFERKAR